MGSVRSPQHSSWKPAVEKLVELVRVMGHEPATPAATRAILGIR
jgi:hypothetical protein